MAMHHQRIIKPAIRVSDAQRARMSAYERRMYARGQRIEAWLESLQRDQQPPTAFAPGCEDPGRTLIDAVAVLLRVQPATLAQMRRGVALNPWAWHFASVVLGPHNQPLPTWREARERIAALSYTHTRGT